MVVVVAVNRPHHPRAVAEVLALVAGLFIFAQTPYLAERLRARAQSKLRVGMAETAEVHRASLLLPEALAVAEAAVVAGYILLSES